MPQIIRQLVCLTALLLATTEASAAPERYPANTVLNQMETQGYQSHLVAAQIGNPPPASSDRASLEVLVKRDINAQKASADAVGQGRIKDSERGDFVNKLRRLAYLSLKEKNSTVWAVLVYLRAKDNKGVIVLRAMTFPYVGKRGEEPVAGSDICIQTRLRNIEVNPSGEVSASSRGCANG